MRERSGDLVAPRLAPRLIHFPPRPPGPMLGRFSPSTATMKSTAALAGMCFLSLGSTAGRAGRAGRQGAVYKQPGMEGLLPAQSPHLPPSEIVAPSSAGHLQAPVQDPSPLREREAELP